MLRKRQKKYKDHTKTWKQNQFYLRQVMTPNPTMTATIINSARITPAKVPTVIPETSEIEGEETPVIQKEIFDQREKEGDLTRSYDEIPYTNRKFENKRTTHKRHQKLTQRLRTDFGRSVGVTSHPLGVVKPVYGYPTFPLTTKAV